MNFLPRIKEKIKQINAAEVIDKEEEFLENIVADEVEEEIDELTDIAAAEIVADKIDEEVDELTESEADVIIAEIAGELVEELSFLEISSIQVSDDQKENSVDTDSTEEGSGNNPTIDFVDSTEIML